ncbi:hypothetical protein HYS97_01905 [Candidatus Daviesbacteria bacterium]|nr:hypothetical protein [Candidatus Daviesbacteria bacterium]
MDNNQSNQPATGNQNPPSDGPSTMANPPQGSVDQIVGQDQPANQTQVSGPNFNLANATVSDGSKKSSKSMLMIAIILVVVVLVIGGFFLLSRSNSSKQTADKSQQANELSQQAESLGQEFNNELDSVELGEVEDAFSEVDSDLNAL